MASLTAQKIGHNQLTNQSKKCATRCLPGQPIRAACGKGVACHHPRLAGAAPIVIPAASPGLCVAVATGCPAGSHSHPPRPIKCPVGDACDSTTMRLQPPLVIRRRSHRPKGSPAASRPVQWRAAEHRVADNQTGSTWSRRCDVVGAPLQQPPRAVRGGARPSILPAASALPGDVPCQSRWSRLGALRDEGTRGRGFPTWVGTLLQRSAAQLSLPAQDSQRG